MAQPLLPAALQAVIDELGSLPGVGARTAERYAYHLLRTTSQANHKLAQAINGLHTGVRSCPVTFALIGADEDVSALYSDPTRNKQLVAVVEEPLDIIALERTGQFSGTYHVLDGIGPEQLHIAELISRIQTDAVEEIIIATNASVEGESTALFLQRHILEAGLHPTMTRLARGLPVGVDLEYADQITLGHALAGRRQLD